MAKTAGKTARARVRPRRRGKGWKAADVVALLTPEYGPFVWRERWDPVTELMFTILSQHTSDINAERAERMLEERFESWEDAAQADVEEIEAAIQVSGLARQKAPRIQGTLRRIMELRGELSLDFLRDLPLDEAKAWMQALPGVGPKTAAVVLCFSLGMPAMAVDTHVHRVSRRLGLIGPKVTAEEGPRPAGGPGDAGGGLCVSRGPHHPRASRVQGAAAQVRGVRAERAVPVAAGVMST